MKPIAYSKGGIHARGRELLNSPVSNNTVGIQVSLRIRDDRLHMTELASIPVCATGRDKYGAILPRMGTLPHMVRDENSKLVCANLGAIGNIACQLPVAKDARSAVN